MILNGNERANAGNLSRHLLNTRDNDHVELHELRGFVADDLHGALQECEAVAMGMEAAREYSSYASALRMRVVELENASAFIIPEAEDACTKAQTELTTGLISGSRGTGPVASKLQSLCTRKSAMADAIQQTLESTTPLVADIRQRSRQIDLLVLHTSFSLGEREIAFIGLARTLEGQLEDLRATDRMRSIRATLSISSHFAKERSNP